MVNITLSLRECQNAAQQFWNNTYQKFAFWVRYTPQTCNIMSLLSPMCISQCIPLYNICTVLNYCVYRATVFKYDITSTVYGLQNLFIFQDRKYFCFSKSKSYDMAEKEYTSFAKFIIFSELVQIFGLIISKHKWIRYQLPDYNIWSGFGHQMTHKRPTLLISILRFMPSLLINMHDITKINYFGVFK